MVFGGVFSCGVGSGECGVGICVPMVGCGECECGLGNLVPGWEVSNLNFLRVQKSPVDGGFCEMGVLNPRYFFVLLSHSDLTGRCSRFTLINKYAYLYSV